MMRHLTVCSTRCVDLLTFIGLSLLCIDWLVLTRFCGLVRVFRTPESEASSSAEMAPIVHGLELFSLNILAHSDRLVDHLQRHTTFSIILLFIPMYA